MNHLRDTDKKEVWTWSVFREVATNLQASYCISLMEWATSAATKVPAFELPSTTIARLHTCVYIQTTATQHRNYASVSL